MKRRVLRLLAAAVLALTALSAGLVTTGAQARASASGRPLGHIWDD